MQMVFKNNFHKSKIKIIIFLSIIGIIIITRTVKSSLIDIDKTNNDPINENEQQQNLKFLVSNQAEENSELKINQASEAKEIKGSPLDGLIPGIGYSSDTLSLGKAVCFQTDRVIKSGQTSILQFEEALDYKTLLQTFSLEVDIKGGYGIFSTNDMFKYFQSLESDSYSLSINYYQKVSQSNVLKYSYDPKKILTKIGSGIYKKNTNPLFRLLCGDTLIGAFEEGAVLILSMKIVFQSREDKAQFDAKIGASLGSFLDASSTISQYSQQYSLKGKVQISGFQLGGDPSHLSRLLGGSVVECDVKNTAACQETAKTLLSYVSKDFPEQFKKDERGIWTTPLVPLTQFKKDFKLEDFGFRISPSYVNKDIETKRISLLNLYNVNKYYFTNLSFMLKSYPIESTPDFQGLLKSLASNLSFLLNGNASGSKALDCFEFPFKCAQSYNSLLKSLDAQASGKLNTLLAEIKRYSSFSIALNQNECLPPHLTWKVTTTVQMNVFPIGNGHFSLSLTSNPLFSSPQADNLHSFAFDGNIPDLGYSWNMRVLALQTDYDSFKGSLHCIGKNFKLDESYDLRGSLLLNPFYFGPYANSNNGNESDSF